MNYSKEFKEEALKLSDEIVVEEDGSSVWAEVLHTRRLAQ